MLAACSDADICRLSSGIEMVDLPIQVVPPEQASEDRRGVYQRAPLTHGNFR